MTGIGRSLGRFLQGLLADWTMGLQRSTRYIEDNPGVVWLVIATILLLVIAS